MFLEKIRRLFKNFNNNLLKTGFSLLRFSPCCGPGFPPQHCGGIEEKIFLRVVTIFLLRERVVSARKAEIKKRQAAKTLFKSININS
jgi:CRISPR/Cas system-associated protein endoribonuclease Cas2